MKVARIDHIRCGEYSACTIVWVRDNMSQTELEERVETAEREYIAALKEFSEQGERPGTNAYGQPNWEANRDRLVGDVLDEHKQAKVERAAYDKARQQALKTFDDFLTAQEGIESFWQDNFALHGEMDWGHQHGTKIEYGETDWPRFRLVKPTKRSAPGGTVMVISDDEEWL